MKNMIYWILFQDVLGHSYIIKYKTNDKYLIETDEQIDVTYMKKSEIKLRCAILGIEDVYFNKNEMFMRDIFSLDFINFCEKILL